MGFKVLISTQHRVVGRTSVCKNTRPVLLILSLPLTVREICTLLPFKILYSLNSTDFVSSMGKSILYQVMFKGSDDQVMFKDLDKIVYPVTTLYFWRNYIYNGKKVPNKLTVPSTVPNPSLHITKE